jgi:hypothetical protein
MLAHEEGSMKLRSGFVSDRSFISKPRSWQRDTKNYLSSSSISVDED